MTENYISAEFQLPQDVSSKPTKKNLSNYVGIGAMFALFIAAGYTMAYILMTNVGEFGGSSIFGSIFGIEYRLNNIGPSLITVIFSRFSLTFGLFWLPSSVIAFLFDR